MESLAGDRRGPFVDAVPVEDDLDAEGALVALYTTQYRSLVRIATLLLHDVPAAEDVVQDAFVAMFAAWRRLRDPDRALAYLRQAVVNRARSRLRHLKVVDAYDPGRPGDAASAETMAMRSEEHRRVMAALRTLPQRQREVLVLRYYADLSEAEIAAALGISRGAVKSHASRAATALRQTLEMTS